MTIAKACRIAGALLAAGALVAACGDSGPAAGAQSDSPVAARLRTAFDLMQKWPGSEVRIGIDAGSTAHTCLDVKGVRKPVRVLIGVSTTQGCTDPAATNSAGSIHLYGDDKAVYELGTAGTACAATAHEAAPEVVRSWTAAQTYQSKTDDIVEAATSLTQDGDTIHADLDPVAALRMSGGDTSGAEHLTATMTVTLSADGSLRTMEFDVDSGSAGTITVRAEFAEADAVDDPLTTGHCTITKGDPIRSEDDLKRLVTP